MRSYRSSVSRRQVKRSISNKNFIFIAGLIILATLWQVFALAVDERTMVFPGPVESFSYAFRLLGKSYTYRCIFSTMVRMLEGFILSLIIGLIFGVITGNYPVFGDLIDPTITALRAVPTASLVYLFIVLAGFRKAPMYLVILISFPIIYEGVKQGIRNIPVSVINATKVDGASFLRNNLRIKLPLAFPYIVTAMASSFSLCFKIEIMAEVITGASTPGLGSAILGARSSDPTNMVPIFGYSLIAVGLMLGIDRLSFLVRDKIRID